MRFLNVCSVTSMVQVDWTNACLVPLYKDKSDKYEYGHLKGISMMSVVGKVCYRILIKRIINGTEGIICEEQSGLKRERSCVDQMFAVRQVYEMFLTKGKKKYLEFLCNSKSI